MQETASLWPSANQGRWETLDVWQRELIGPLEVLRQPVRLLIDGFDQLDGTVHGAPLRRALTELMETVVHASLVLTSRSDPGLPGTTVMAMPPLDEQVARRYLRGELADGRWLVLELASGQAAADSATSLDGLYDELMAGARARWGAPVEDVLALLAAAGTGPILPIDVLEAALAKSGHTTRATLFAILGDEDLYRVIDRAGPGTPTDRVGLFHQTLADYIAARSPLLHGHRAIAEALDELADDHDPKDFRHQPIYAYAFDAQPSHWWEGEHPDRVVATLRRRTDVIPGVNLERWGQWSARLQDALGPDHPDTLTTRGNIAHWTGQSGDAPGALELSKELLPDHERVLGPDHPDTLTTEAWIEELRTRLEKT